LVEKWDKDEAVKDAKTWETAEGSEKAINHILNKYVRTRTDMKINPSKQTAHEVLDLFTNTFLFDKKFHHFALDNYNVLTEYDRKKNVLDIVKIKDF
jgi:hypothetical protein